MNRIRTRVFTILTSLIACSMGYAQLSETKYTDPKGFFVVRPPKQWTVKDYPEDARGKVAFFGPNRVDIRVLVNAVDYNTFDALVGDLNARFAKVGISATTKRVDWYGIPVLERVFEFKGLKMLYRDFLVGKVAHNIAYSAPTAEYDKHLPVAQLVMENYTPVHKDIDPAAARSHSVAKNIRLAKLMLEQGNKGLAREYAKAALEVDPNSKEAKEMLAQAEK